MKQATEYLNDTALRLLPASLTGPALAVFDNLSAGKEVPSYRCYLEASLGGLQDFFHARWSLGPVDEFYLEVTGLLDNAYVSGLSTEVGNTSCGRNFSMLPLSSTKFRQQRYDVDRAGVGYGPLFAVRSSKSNTSYNSKADCR